MKMNREFRNQYIMNTKTVPKSYIYMMSNIVNPNNLLGKDFILRILNRREVHKITKYLRKFRTRTKKQIMTRQKKALKKY